MTFENFRESLISQIENLRKEFRRQDMADIHFEGTPTEIRLSAQIDTLSMVVYAATYEPKKKA